MYSAKKTASENAEHLALLKKQYKDFGDTLKLLEKASGVRRPRAPSEKSAGSAWSNWPAKDLFPEEYKEHLASLPPNEKGVQKKSDPFGFAKACKDTLHVDEWKEFEAKWKAEHPKVEKPKAAAKPKGAAKAKAEPEPEAEPEAEPKAKPKPKAKAKAEELKPASEGEEEKEEKFSSSSSSLPAATPAPAAAAKPKAPSKAEKAAAKEAAVAAASEAAKADPPVPWMYRGKAYLKNDKGQIWTVGPGETVGDWHGTYDGKKVEKSDGPV